MVLAGLLNQSISLESFASINGYGDCSYNTAATYPARVERRVKVVRSLKGETVVSTACVFLDGSVSLDKLGRDRITLPDGTKPVILAIEDGVDGAGNTVYVEVNV